MDVALRVFQAVGVEVGLDDPAPIAGTDFVLQRKPTDLLGGPIDVAALQVGFDQLAHERIPSRVPLGQALDLADCLGKTTCRQQAGNLAGQEVGTRLVALRKSRQFGRRFFQATGFLIGADQAPLKGEPEGVLGGKPVDQLRTGLKVPRAEVHFHQPGDQPVALFV